MTPAGKSETFSSTTYGWSCLADNLIVFKNANISFVSGSILSIDDVLL